MKFYYSFYNKMIGAGIIPIHFCGDNIRILLVRGKQSGKWSFPKGHLEQNEDLIGTAIREMKEETNIDVSERDIDKRITLGDYTFFLVRMYKLEKVTKQESEILEYSWMLLEDIMKLDMKEVNYPLKIFRFFVRKNKTIKEFIRLNSNKIYIIEP